jgi:hypothetical protein
MSYALIASVIIILIITTVLLVIFIPRPICYYDPIDICKELLLLSEAKYFEKIKNEITTLEQSTTLNEKLFYKNMLELKFKELPDTYELFRTIPNLRSVHIYTLGSKTETTRQKGTPEDVNHTLAAILPVRISGAKKNTLWCDGESKFFEEGKWIIYDASREHSFNNKHKKSTTVYLHITLDRPSYIPMGIA